MEAAKGLVIKGMGLCFLPFHAVCAELTNQQLVHVRLTTELNIHTEVSIAYLKDKPVSEIIEFCVGVAESK